MTNLSDLLDDCDGLSRFLHVDDRHNELAELMRFRANLRKPIHRWYKFKEAFSCHLVPRLLREYMPIQRRSATFLDPFCGVGTSLLAAEEFLATVGVKRITIRGIEVNPYVRFVANTKLAWDRYDPAWMMRAAAASTNGFHLRGKPELPVLSTMRNEDFVSPAQLHELIELREKIRVLTAGRLERRPLLLGLASASERIFKLRKDGRALRHIPRTRTSFVHQEVGAEWNEILEDLQLGLERTPVDYGICLGDGRRPDLSHSGAQFDIILFSPPYLNNIDYTEVYKIELWLLGFLTSTAQMVAQRRRTFRSHPSCLFPESQDASTVEVKRILGAEFGRLLEYAGRTQKWRERLFAQYFADMLRTLRGCSRLISPEGRIFLIIGNSLHGDSDHPVPVATDLWTCKLARAAGLKVQVLVIGRQFTRRRFVSPLLRESIIILSKR